MCSTRPFDEIVESAVCQNEDVPEATGGQRMRNEADHLNHQRWLDAIISIAEATKLRGISVRTLRSEIRRGALKDIRISKKRRGMTRREALRDSRV